MADEKPNKYERLPIPSYDEATSSSSSSRTTPSANRSTPNEPSQPAEREGLLSYDNPTGRIPVPTRRAGYRPPPTEETNSVRASLDHENDTFLGQDDGRERGSDDDNAVRREMEEMEILEPESATGRPSSRWGKRISSLSQSLSAINLPFKWKLPFKITLRWPTLDANFCIILSRCFAILLVIGIVYLLFVSDVFTSAAQRMAGQMFDPESVRMHVQARVDERQIADRLRRITMADHLAGTEGDYVLAQWIEGVFVASGLEDVKVEEYGVYLNYPKKEGRKVELLNGDGSVQFTADLEEGVDGSVYRDPPRQETPVFHALSRSGDVTGPLIYANYGTREDFKRLYDSGIDTTGAIALVRNQGRDNAALKVKAAELAGFAGCLIYSDPADDGAVKGEVAPNGRFMPIDGVQRGSAALTSWRVGDVLTPERPSIKGASRLSKDNNPGLVNIPSLPISAADATSLLSAIQDFGQACPDEWKGGIQTPYWSGNLSSPHVRLLNQQDEVEQQPIWNIMGKIQGVEQREKSILIGNHRDAWVYGATSPGSGTAIMLEVITVFADLIALGWRPLRTIEFASWDAGVYNLVGSTEYVENNVGRLRADALAYLNLDVGVSGTEFHAAGSPMFHKSLLRILARVSDPLQNVTLRELWDRRHGDLDNLGSDSDYLPFQSIAGTSSLDLSFKGSAHPYNSAYDTFELMSNTGDPGFQYHKTLAQIISLLVLELCDRPVLPFDLSAYSASLTSWAMDLENWAGTKGANQDGNPKWSTEPLREAVLQFAKDARVFERWEMDWDAVVLGGQGYENAGVAAHRRSRNARMGEFETRLLDLEVGGGIPNRTQFKHTIFGPQMWPDGKPYYFPAVRDAVEAGEWALAQSEVEKVAGIIKGAGAKLVGN